MPKREVLARPALAAQRIFIASDLAAWARKRGLLGAYVEYLPRSTNLLPARWQVVRPGHRTSREGPPWQRGNKTFIVHSVPDKHRAEEAAVAWASAHFGVTGWVRIEGLGSTLFPEPVAEELARYVPDLIVWKRRQHSGKSARAS